MKVQMQLVVIGTPKEIAAAQKKLKGIASEDDEDEDNGSEEDDSDDGDSDDDAGGEGDDADSGDDDSGDDSSGDDAGDDGEEDEAPKKRGRKPGSTNALTQEKVMVAFKKFASSSDINLKKVKAILKALKVKSVRELPEAKLRVAMAKLKMAGGK